MPRGQNVAANAVLVRIDNPETLAKHEQAVAAKLVADAQLANINVGTRAEVIAARKAALDRAQAALVLAQKTYDRIRQLAEHGIAPQAQLDQATESLHESRARRRPGQIGLRTGGQRLHARGARDRGGKRRQGGRRHQGRPIDHRSDGGLRAGGLAGLSAQCGARRICLARRAADHADRSQRLWIHFDLREDLVKTIKVGDRFDVRIPALGDRRITVEVKLIATKGEYASWRATRATGDFDLRTFSIRAYPVEKVPELRPGMSAYLDWRRPMRARRSRGFWLVARREWRWMLHDRWR